MRVGRVFDLGDDFFRQCGVINGFWVQTLLFAIFNFFQICSVQAHG
jgi:hypothetical protein